MFADDLHLAARRNGNAANGSLSHFSFRLGDFRSGSQPEQKQGRDEGKAATLQEDGQLFARSGEHTQPRPRSFKRSGGGETGWVSKLRSHQNTKATTHVQRWEHLSRLRQFAPRGYHEGAPGPPPQARACRRRPRPPGHADAHEKPLTRGVARLGAKASDQRLDVSTSATSAGSLVPNWLDLRGPNLKLSVLRQACQGDSSQAPDPLAAQVEVAAMRISQTV